ncbi:glycosyltransferase [Pseudomonadota bacterium]
MMRFGNEICEGYIDERGCAKCFANSRGLPKSIAGVVSIVPNGLSKFVLKKNMTGEIASAAGVKALTHGHKNSFHEMVQISDKIVVLSQWMYDRMRINGVEDSKLSLIRHGIDASLYTRHGSQKTMNESLKIGFLGRADPIKGIGRIVDAVKKLDLRLCWELHIYAIVGNDQEMRYIEDLKRVSDADPRIRFENSVIQAEVPQVMATLDVLAVPSQWLETGPLVVLEALAARTPVLGSDLGGIREHIQDGVNGRLLSPSRTDDWTSAIRELIDHPERLDRLRKNIKQVRSMDDVAGEMIQVYKEVMNNNATIRRPPKQVTGVNH